MRRTKFIAAAILGTAIAAGAFAAPAMASRESDEATRVAARMYAQQLGLPSNYFDVQHAQQKMAERFNKRNWRGNKWNNNRWNNNVNQFSNFAPYGGYYPNGWNGNYPYNNYNYGNDPYNYGYNTYGNSWLPF